MEAADLVADLEQQLRPLGTVERADGERRYLRSSLTHLGVRLPQIRTTTSQFLTSHPALDRRDRLELVEALWGAGVFELRQAAVHVLERSVADLDVGVLGFVEGLLRRSHTWALVDPVSVNVVGAIAVRDPRTWPALDRWIADDDMWIRRAALLAHLPALRTDRARFDHFAGYAERVLEEREFFIRKAIGWVLREVGKRDPEVVTRWLEPRIGRASGVTVREATKYLPAADRDRLLQGYRRAAGGPRPRRPGNQGGVR